MSDLICHVAKVRAARSAHSMANVIHFLFIAFKVAQNSFQHFLRHRFLMGHYYHSLSVDATIMVSKHCPIIGEHVGIIFVTL